MPLIFKLVGYVNVSANDGSQVNSGKPGFYQITHDFEGTFNINYIHQEFRKMGVHDDCFENIKFISDSEQIKNEHKLFNVKDGEDKIIHVFTSDPELRVKLSEVFSTNGKMVEHAPIIKSEPVVIPQVMIQPLQVKEVERPLVDEMTPEIIEMMNKKTIQLFTDNDFTNLLSIYLRRPELFNTLSKYIQHGTIVEEISDVLSDENIEHYKQLASELKIDVTEEVKIQYLVKYKGHLNLTLRAIICDYLLVAK